VLKNSDFITLHIPKDGGKSIIGAEEIGMMKTGAGIINAARGGVIDETALMFALDKEKLAYAGLDVFENEPNPSIHLLMHGAVSLTPHIGAATLEAQDRIGTELAKQICAYFNKQKWQ
jgi:D-3-phosphoglycerate dehydrogenase